MSGLATSESEEMYLITIAMAIEDGHEGPVPVPRVAETLDVSRVSANEMVKKLVSRGLVEYTPYKGVDLTDEGYDIALTILRRRRLWSVFLTDQLGLTPRQADVVACEFEHVTPADVAKRLASFLGDPQVGPQGKRIPDATDSTTEHADAGLLHDAPLSVPHEVVRIDGDAPGRSFLAGEGIAPGEMVVVEALSQGGGCLLVTPKGRLHLSPEIAKNIFVVDAQ